MPKILYANKRRARSGTALGLLSDLWAEFPAAVESSMGTPKAVLHLLKKGARESNVALQITSLTNLFNLLDEFAVKQNSYAPYVYKTLIFALIENHGNEIIRDFMTTNMMLTIDRLPNVPVGIMVEPLVKQATLHGYMNTDFDLFQVISKHARLGLRHGLILLDLLGKICLNDPLFGRVASVPFLRVTNRFHAQEPLQEYIERFCKVALSMFMHVEARARRQHAKGRCVLRRERYAGIDRTQ